ncbi:hypothetical protein LCGC14_1569620 [marine sediment metagenome]|uniref:Uncharacterized protein n=1 Tax=marine sediment metagenome TaxID=412755 RepID=A0A0F9IK15_9ZZZZ
MGVERNMHDNVTHWPNAGSDGFGGFTYGAPVTFKGRWEDKNVLFLTLAGEEETSNAVVYVPQAVAIGDYLGQGDLTADADPTAIDGPFRIRGYNRSTDLRGLNQIMKAIL